MNRRAEVSKRAFDLVMATLLLVLAAPVMAVAALLVLVTSGRPILHRARRAGRHGRPFWMLKFRTMRPVAVGSRITNAKDARVTRVGALMRKAKIDELPQLFNVLRGEMSIVGPRPEDCELVDRCYTSEMRRALEARPGLAGPAEVLYYPDLTFHDPPPVGVAIETHYVERHLPLQAGLAVRYVDEQSMRLDLKILVQVGYCVLVRSWAPRSRPVPLPMVRPSAAGGAA